MPRVSDMKKRLTDAALDLMWENSYGTTSVDAICERAGANKGSFYYYFKSAIRDAHAQGLIVAPDPEAKARALFACYHGTLAQARIQNDLSLLRDFKRVAMDVLGVKQVQATSS